MSKIKLFLGTYSDVIERLDLPTDFLNPIDSIESLKKQIDKDIIRTPFIETSRFRFSDFLELIGDASKISRIYTQGDLDGGIFPWTLRMHQLAHFEEGTKEIRFAYINDLGVPCGFCMICSAGNDNLWIASVVTNTLAPPSERRVTVFGHERLISAPADITLETDKVLPRLLSELHSETVQTLLTKPHDLLIEQQESPSHIVSCVNFKVLEKLQTQCDSGETLNKLTELFAHLLLGSDNTVDPVHDSKILIILFLIRKAEEDPLILRSISMKDLEQLSCNPLESDIAQPIRSLCLDPVILDIFQNYKIELKHNTDMYMYTLINLSSMACSSGLPDDDEAQEEIRKKKNMALVKYKDKEILLTKKITDDILAEALQPKLPTWLSTEKDLAAFLNFFPSNERKIALQRMTTIPKLIKNVDHFMKSRSQFLPEDIHTILQKLTPNIAELILNIDTINTMLTFYKTPVKQLHFLKNIQDQLPLWIHSSDDFIIAFQSVHHDAFYMLLPLAQSHLKELVRLITKNSVGNNDVLLKDYCERSRQRIMTLDTLEEVRAINTELQLTLASVSSKQVIDIKKNIITYRQAATFFNRKNEKAEKIEHALSHTPLLKRGTIISLPTPDRAVQNALGWHRLRNKIGTTECLRTLQAQYPITTPVEEKETVAMIASCKKL